MTLEYDAAALDRLVRDGVEETENLEFKRWEALEDGKEMCRDVTAMANGAGGVIIYGVGQITKAENKRIGVAAFVEGADPTKFSRDRIHQMLNGGIQPILRNVVIKAIDLPTGKVAFVVEVPQATSFAPHQATAHEKYFYRSGTEVRAMADYQVRDVMGRQTRPELALQFQLTRPLWEGDRSTSHVVSVWCSNGSSAPAMYCDVDMLFETELALNNRLADWSDSRELTLIGGATVGMTCVSRSFTTQDPPFFREKPRQIYVQNLTVKAGCVYQVGYRIFAPGFKVERFGEIFSLGTKPLVRWRGGA